MQKQKFFFFAIVFSFCFFWGENISVVYALSCEGTTVWGSNLKGTCKRTCLASPKEVSLIVAASCNEGDFCCVSNPNIGKQCSAVIGGQTKSGLCQASSDCSSATNDIGQDISVCKSDLVCCVPKNSGGGGGTGGGGTGGGGTGGGGTGGGGTGGGGTGGGTAVACENAPGMIKVGPTCVSASAGLSRMTIGGIFVVLLRWLLYILGFLGALAFIISGVMYLTSAGDGTLIDRAKDYMIWSIVGVIVALSGLIIVNAINGWLQGGWYYF